MSLSEQLHRLGLAPKEAAVYLSLLELGTASVQAIARRADVVRPTVYVILEHLVKKGLVSKATGPDAKKMLFRVEDPDRLERYVDQQLEELQHRRKDLLHIIPDLRSAFAVGEDRPRVRLFEGKDGLKQLQSEFVAAGSGPIIGMTSPDDLFALFPEPEFHEEIRAIRLRAGVVSRNIYVSARTRFSPEEDRKFLRESRYLSTAQLPIHGSYYVNGTVLSLVSHRSKIIGTLIEHQDIADSFRAVFEVLWAVAAPSPAWAAAPAEAGVLAPSRSA